MLESVIFVPGIVRPVPGERGQYIFIGGLNIFLFRLQFKLILNLIKTFKDLLQRQKLDPNKQQN